ncbi:MAG TPA: cytochrome c [Bacteroidales bacterium]|nr:cytochrome c [Bacteroidales bacterium]
MKKIIITIIITLAVILAAFTAFIYSGAFDVSQLTPHKAITLWIINTTRDRSIDKRIKNIQVPPLNDTSLYAEGFMHYNEMCVICHGAPGIEPGEMTEGLYPTPPVFYKSDDMPEPNESFWIIKNGIKMTSMPAFGPTHSDQKIWAITAFLLNKMNNMSPGEYKLWEERYQESDTTEFP